jgi:hypothetical protein
MPKTSQLSFNGGEFTEFMDPRVDVAKYGKGCRLLENFYVLPFGAALARPGTKHGGVTKHQDRKARLQPFSFSTTTTFDIEAGHEYFRFWKDQAQVNAPTPAAWVTATAYEVDDYVLESSISYRCIEAHTAGVFATDLAAVKWEALEILEVTSPYQEEHLYELQFEQVQDVVYIAHASYPIKKLVRYADDDWRLESVSFEGEYDYPPLAPRNFDETKTIAIGAGYDTKGSSVTLTASVSMFTENQVGDTLMIGHVRDETTIRHVVSATGPSSSIYVLGDWSFQTVGAGTFKVTLEESIDNATWINRRQYDINGTENNALVSGSEQTPKYFRINITNYTSTSEDGTVILEVSDALVPGLVRITGYTSGTVLTAKVIEPLHSGDATYRWAEQFFSARRGYARAVCISANRLCIGSTDVWLSQPGNYENFRPRNDADSGFSIAIRRSGSPFVQWMEDLRGLRIGTTQAEAVIVPESTTEVLSYSNYLVRWDTNYGSKYIRAVPVNGTAFFLQPEGRTLRSQELTGIEEYYDANSLTLLADHILGDGVVQTAFQRQRYPTFHGVRSDGQLASLTYEASQDVKAWHRMVTDGAIESISVTPRPDEEDRVAYIVKRTINGSTVRHVEFKASGQYRILQDENLSEMFFVDDGIRVEGSGMTSVSGLDHLEGATVAVLADGSAIPDKVVSGGSIDLDYAADVVIVGLPYEMKLTPMFLESSSIMGQSKHICAAIIRLWRSGELRVRVDGGRYDRLTYPSDEYAEAPPLRTGDSDKIIIGGEWERNTSIELVGRSPLPLNVQAITLEFEVGRH